MRSGQEDFTVVRMRSLFVVVLIGLVAGVSCGEKARFDNYRVYSVPIHNEDQLRLLQEIDENPNGVKNTDH